MDIQWIVDKIYEAGRLIAAAVARIDNCEEDIQDLKELPERVTSLETRVKYIEDQRQIKTLVAPSHRQIWLSLASVFIALAALIVTIVLKH
jgi:hypothetical protein